MNSYFANQLSTQAIKAMPKSTQTVICASLSGPYCMFGPGRVIETVQNTTSKNSSVSVYKITTSETSNFGMGRCGNNTVETAIKPFRLFDVLNRSTRYNHFTFNGK